VTTSTARLVLLLGVLSARLASGEPPSVPAPGSCAGGAVDATVSLVYDERVLGDVTGVFVAVSYPERTSLPGRDSEAPVRARVTSLLGPHFRLLPVDEDVDGDGRDDRLRFLLATTEKAALPPKAVARVRFDCAPNGLLSADAFRCTTDQVADDAGQLMRPETARQVTCTVLLAEPPAAPASTR
jgi:hypothetical protein